MRVKKVYKNIIYCIVTVTRQPWWLVAPRDNSCRPAELRAKRSRPPSNTTNSAAMTWLQWWRLCRKSNGSAEIAPSFANAVLYHWATCKHCNYWEMDYYEINMNCYVLNICMDNLTIIQIKINANDKQAYLEVSAHIFF